MLLYNPLSGSSTYVANGLQFEINFIIFTQYFKHQNFVKSLGSFLAEFKVICKFNDDWHIL